MGFLFARAGNEHGSGSIRCEKNQGVENKSAEFLVQQRGPVSVRLDVQDGCDEREKLGNGEGFGEEGPGAVLNDIPLRAGEDRAGDEKDAESRPREAEGFGKLDAAEAGHVQIGEEEIDLRVPAKDGQGALGITATEDLVTVGAEEGAGELAQLGVVVDEEDAADGGGGDIDGCGRKLSRRGKGAMGRIVVNNFKEVRGEDWHGISLVLQRRWRDFLVDPQ